MRAALPRESHLREQLSRAALPLRGDPSDFDSLIDRVGDAQFVLLGEATHGTHEFYQARAEITQRLIVEKGFTVVAWEADWPDALRINRFIHGSGRDKSPREALLGFQRFPVWMWRNQVILRLVEWLGKYNSSRPEGKPKAGIYGLDLYSLHASMEAVIQYLDKVDPTAAADARKRYSCFENFGDDPQSYGMTANLDRSLSCEEEVVKQLIELQRNADQFLSRDGRVAADELFYAEQNALVARNAEVYYRAMYRGRPNTWNLRDTHMVDTLDRLMEHLRMEGENPKAVIWAHNSHLGDARATQMGRRDEINVGQLVRERHIGNCVLVGFTTYTGRVTAASNWGGRTERKWVRPALEGSFERLFHEIHHGHPSHGQGINGFFLRFDEHPELAEALNSGKLERAIGVIYLPETERYSHYFAADLGDQFDAVFHYEETTAVEPLDRTPHWDKGELPETYPSGL